MSTKQAILDIMVQKGKYGDGFETIILHREGTEDGDELEVVSAITIFTEAEPMIMVDGDEVPYTTNLNP